jgi:extracellular matrix regulatory protein A
MKRDLSPVLVNIGFGNVVSASRVVAIVTPGSSPMKRLRDEAKKRGKLIDATEGRRTRSIIVTDSDHIILSALQTETISQRFGEGKETEGSAKEPKPSEYGDTGDDEESEG